MIHNFMILSPTWRGYAKSPRPLKVAGFFQESKDSHIINNLLAKLAALQLGRAVHQTLEVIGHALFANRALDALDDQLAGFLPAHILEHHDTREDDRARVDLVESGVFRRGSVGRLEDGKARVIVDIGARGDADAADLRGHGVGDMVAVEVHRRDHIVLGRARQNLLEEGVGDGVLDQQFAGVQGSLLLGVGGVLALLGLGALPLRPGVGLVAVLFVSDLISPILEGTFGELHDIALVDNRQAATFARKRIVERRAHQTLGAFLTDRLDADAGGLRETNRIDAQLFLHELDDLLGFVALGPPLDAGIDVFGIFAEDDHIAFLGLFDRARHALEPAHRAHACVQVKLLAKRDVQRAKPPADRRGQRALDGDQALANRVEGRLRKPLTGDLLGLLPGINLLPLNLALAAVGLLDRSVENPLGRRPDIRADSVSLNKRNDRIVRDHKLAIFFFRNILSHDQSPN